MNVMSNKGGVITSARTIIALFLSQEWRDRGVTIWLIYGEVQCFESESDFPGGAYLAKPYSAKPESAVQESAKPYLAKPGNC